VKSFNIFGEGWLPTSIRELKALGWEELDVILFSGDAYVDHPSFGTAVIARIIEDEGFKIAIVPQPNWKDDLRDFRKFGKPKYFFGVTAGNMDSMVNHYTAARRLRSDDAYSPGGKAGFRPDYPTIVYTRILKKLYPDVPVVLGGIEASMRRLSHYDYWKDKLEPSILISSGADLLVYGMGEQPLREMLKLLKKGVPFSSLSTVPQIAFTENFEEGLPLRNEWRDIELKSFEACLSDKKLFAANFVAAEKESNKANAARLIEPSGKKKVIINPPFSIMTSEEADRTYDLPFRYLPHPRYSKKDSIPAYEMIKFSVNIHRGCFGGCSFCAISAHQGKQIVSRSEQSIVREVKKIAELPDFKGNISDLGGPSANMYGMKGKDQKLCSACARASCIWPGVCRNLDTSHRELTRLYRKIDGIEGIKKTFIGSGVRYDLLFREWNPGAGEAESEYLDELIKNHVSGRLKVAPEHTSLTVLNLMRKPGFDLFRKLNSKFKGIIKKHGLRYEIVPYFISSHPGCTITDMKNLAEEIKDLGLRPEQVQDFTPTPMTLSTAMYYLGFDPYTGRSVFVERDTEAKKRQKEFFFWDKPKTQWKTNKPISDSQHEKGTSKRTFRKKTG
jgi:uncharacterized radical SAM protein YgiQ